MRKTLILLFVLAVAFSCSSEPQYKINIEMEDLAGQQVKLNKRDGSEFMVIDSVVLNSSGKGVLMGVIEGQELMYITTDSLPSMITLFMDHAEYSITGTMEDPEVKVDAGAHIEWQAYQEGTKEYTEAMSDIYTAYQYASQTAAEQNVLDSLRNAYMAISEKVASFDSVYKIEHPGSIASLFLLRSNFYALDTEELEKALEPFSDSYASSPYYTYLESHVERMKAVEVGQKYVDFELPDTAGNPVKLSDVAEKGVLLIDFWASWCGPCRRANPGVVEIYNEFHDRGFDIIGVSLDRDRDAWLQGIEEDGLTWTHVSDLAFWDSEAGKLYAVASIPHTVLLDEDGTIIAKNLEKEELKAKLEELL